MKRAIQLGAGGVYGVALPHCGASRLITIAWLLQHGRPPADPSATAALRASLPRSAPLELVKRSPPPTVLGLVRRPVERFLAFYYDQIWNPSHKVRPALMRRFHQQAGTKLRPDLTPAEHVENCHRALDRIEATFAAATGPVNAQWRPQSEALAAFAAVGMQVSTMRDLQRKIAAWLPAPEAALVRQHAAPVPDSPPLLDLADPGLEARITRIYAADTALFEVLERHAAKQSGPDQRTRFLPLSDLAALILP